jgi:5-oxoprolinase (ATP-hydrolysing) subunit A
MKLDLNCDLGEGEPNTKTRALMRSIPSANIACGGHAGNLETMRTAVRLALVHNVRIGAHPGLADRENFGRKIVPLKSAELELLILHQVSALEKIVAEAGGRLHHIKAHGALYHMVEAEPNLRKALCDLIRELWPSVRVYCLPDGKLFQEAREHGLSSWGEGFLDRAYNADGSLVARHQPGAVLSLKKFVERLDLIAGKEPIRDVNGDSLRIRAQTWCLHSDTQHAVRFAQLAAQRFKDAPPLHLRQSGRNRNDPQS